MENNPVLAQLKAQIDRPAMETPSAFGRWLGGILRAAEAGQLVADYTVRAEMLNPVGKLHGGVTAAIFDDLIGATMFSLGLPDFMSTINLTVDYLGAARLGDVVRVSTDVTKVGKQFLHATATMHDQQGKTIATATTNLFRVPMPG
jgi:acyl-coenzyme A thioesterase 13